MKSIEAWLCGFENQNETPLHPYRRAIVISNIVAQVSGEKWEPCYIAQAALISEDDRTRPYKVGSPKTTQREALEDLDEKLGFEGADMARGLMGDSPT